MDIVEISIAIYSGRKNPKKSVQLATWKKLIGALEITNEKTIQPPQNISIEKGSVITTGEFESYCAQIFPTAIDGETLTVCASLADKEMAVTWSEGTTTVPTYLQWIKELQILSPNELKSLQHTYAASATLPFPTINIAPYVTKELAYWNWQPASAFSYNVCVNNNCYNFAVSLRTNTYAQPGLGSGIPAANYLDPLQVLHASTRDGLFSLGVAPIFPLENNMKASSSALVALVMGLDIQGNFMDYHWFRLSRYGTTNNNYVWSDKPGWGLVRSFGNPVSYADINAELIRILASQQMRASYPGGAGLVSYLLADPRVLRIS